MWIIAYEICYNLREEQIDNYWEATYMKSGFMPEGRRKRWRERAFATMENQCKSYIEVFLSQPDQSGSDAAWLIHQLELAKSQIMGDLKVNFQLLEFSVVLLISDENIFATIVLKLTPALTGFKGPTIFICWISVNANVENKEGTQE